MQISARSLPGQPRGNTIDFYPFPGLSKETLIQMAKQMQEQFYFSRVTLAPYLCANSAKSDSESARDNIGQIFLTSTFYRS